MYPLTHKAAILFLEVVLLFVVSASSSSDESLLQILCSTEENGVYSSNSSFGSNLKQLLGMLASNTPRTGFYSRSVGNGKDQVFGQALCRGDVGGSVCLDCLRIAGQEIMSNCSSMDADIWYEHCQISYSFSDFFSVMNYLGKYPDQNQDADPVSDPDWSGTTVLENLKDDLKRKVNLSQKKFAVSKSSFSKKASVYGLAQCTLGINGDECGSCLEMAFGDLTSCCAPKDSGIVVSRYCNVRFGLDQFYNSDSTGNETLKVSLAISIPTFALAVLICYCVVYSRRQSRREQKDEETNSLALLQELANPISVAVSEDGQLVSSKELLFIEFSIIKAATQNFSDQTKLGEGGFGQVYGAVLNDGKEVAVKKLSKKSMQGLEEVKNEIEIIARLKHRNLVRLLGWSVGGDEKLLIYELMPNRSLDKFIFNPQKSWQLNWKTRRNIIDGIARGLLHLHEDSRPKIIHRDLKPSNVLLDEDMVAKISDFGMARIFSDKQYTANTKRIVGTFGYMAPEYAMEGLFSVKSDVYSFGVIVLEIICGKKNVAFHLTKSAWMLWKDEREMKIVDPCLVESCTAEEVRRTIHIGLLCVQEDPADRPTMAEVVVLLEGGSEALPEPRQPAISMRRDSSILDVPSFSLYTSANDDNSNTISGR